MTPADPAIAAIFPLPRLDPDSDHWVRTLSGTVPSGRKRWRTCTSCC